MTPSVTKLTCTRCGATSSSVEGLDQMLEERLGQPHPWRCGSRVLCPACQDDGITSLKPGIAPFLRFLKSQNAKKVHHEAPGWLKEDIKTLHVRVTERLDGSGGMEEV